jgi:hypothetical protein
MVGRATPPRPLHFHLTLSRNIVITEQMDRHFLWRKGGIFLKPIPRCLLHPKFWEEQLYSLEDCKCFQTKKANQHAVEHRTTKQDENNVRKCDGGLRKRALGFLSSYVALLAYESDFRVAKEKHLVPEELTWEDWRKIVAQLDLDNIISR